MATNTTDLKNFAQNTRRQLREQVAARMEQVLQTDSAEIREQAQAIRQLQEQIAQSSKAAVIDRAAYTWFNRFCALRFMDVRNYNRVRAVSPQDGFTQPEILQEAKQGIIDEGLTINRQRVFDLLSGRLPSRDPQGEAYRLLLVGVCNEYHQAMPFLFEEIADYTELLMPEDLLSENSVLHAARQALTAKACEDVEVIGWLYQYYISERKDEVFAALKQNQKIEAEDIPAATQLFTPHWIVRYLVENSLGRLWMLNHPNSRLIDQMEYYIAPNTDVTASGSEAVSSNEVSLRAKAKQSPGDEEIASSEEHPPRNDIVKEDFLKINSPEEIRLCDPACGSGHMLTYAFDLLYAIYEEQGYDPVQIPQLILQKNLYGIEIDQRAGHLAAFALTMKARERDRRFFTRKVEPNICVLRNVSFTTREIDEYMQAVGRDLFTQNLWLTLRQFEQAENFGTLIRPALKEVGFVRQRLEEQGVFENLFLHNTNQKVEQVLEMSEYLSPRYHMVVANPPYMGSRGMMDDFKEFAKNNFTDSKSDTFAMFIERGFELILNEGFNAMVTMESWMFLSSFTNLRQKILTTSTILSMVHMPYLGKGGTSMGINFGTSATIFCKKSDKKLKGQFVYVRYFECNQAGVPKQFPVINERLVSASAEDFEKIPGYPISYWINDSIRDAFQKHNLSKIAESGGRCKTHNDDQYLRKVWEVDASSVGLTNTWCILYKGGPFRKYYGNRDYVIRWTKDAKEHYRSVGGLTNAKYWNLLGITWTIVTSKDTCSFRIKDSDGQYSSVSPTIFIKSKKVNIISLLGLLNSSVANYLFRTLNPTLALNVGDVKNFPIFDSLDWEELRVNTDQLVQIATNDWITQEMSLEFSENILIKTQFHSQSIENTYTSVSNYWKNRISIAQKLEENNNLICSDAYGLKNEIPKKVPLEEITLNCNPYYRYQNTSRKTYSNDEREAILLADTMKEFISYAVGCMFGRYSLDKPGLILANQGETLREYLKQIPDPSFPADDDNVIPVLDEGWFDDDIVERFKRFLRVTFGEEHYEENLAFLENAIGKDIRTYFLRDFYNEHVKMYKKRPIYWLFSSPQGSFNALIYMHRYRPDTVSVILNDYLRQYREKLTAHRAYQEQVAANPSAAQRDKTNALKEIEKINKVLVELKEYEDEVLYPLATQQIEIDLDDGVKVNYPKFGAALKKVSGLS